jgi:hypothetical protein
MRAHAHKRAHRREGSFTDIVLTFKETPAAAAALTLILLTWRIR